MRRLRWKQAFSFTCLIATTALSGLGLNAAVKLDASPDRVKTPLRVDMERIGAQEVRRNQARYIKKHLPGFAYVGDFRDKDRKHGGN